MDVNAYEQEKELVNELKRKHLCSETDVARAIARFDYNKWSLTKAISGVYPISQLMNHSCLPNVALVIYLLASTMCCNNDVLTFDVILAQLPRRNKRVSQHGVCLERHRQR